MAIAVDAVSSNSSNGTLSLTIAHTCSGANRLLVVGVGAGATVSSITYNGTALTQIIANNNAGNFFSELWYLINPDTGTNNIIVTMSAGGTSVSAGGLSFTGAAQSSPIDGSNSDTGNSQFTSVSVTTSSNNTFVVTTAVGGAASWTADTGQTLQWNTIGVTRATALETIQKTSPTTFSSKLNQNVTSPWASTVSGIKEFIAVDIPPAVDFSVPSTEFRIKDQVTAY